MVLLAGFVSYRHHRRRGLPIGEWITVTQSFLWKEFANKLCGSWTCKPNSVRNTNAAGRSFLWARHYCRAQATYPEVVTRRAGTYPERTRKLPPYLVLLRVGFALPAALLRRRCALTAPFHPYLSVAAGAVCFLWHFPSNGPAQAKLGRGTLPDVIRHTALRSSDFPPSPLDAARATVRSSCQRIHCSSPWETFFGPWPLVLGRWPTFMADAPRSATTRG